MRVFNEPAGHRYLERLGVDAHTVEALPMLGISGIGNLIAAIKAARYWELGADDVLVTVFTDSMQLYNSRVAEERERHGELDEIGAARAFARAVERQATDNTLELTYYERLRIHNLKYYTWIEQQGKDVEELRAQWYDREYWRRVQESVGEIDELIESFNDEVLA
jgi:hypothetical protein